MKRSEQIEALLRQRQQQRQEEPLEGDDRSPSTSGSEASFKTASEGGPPKLRLVSPSGGSYAPSFPSSVASFASAFPDPPSSAPPLAPPAQPQAQPNAAAPTAPAQAAPAVSSGLMARLKAQRAAKLAEPEGGAAAGSGGPPLVPSPTDPHPSSPRPSQLDSPSLKSEPRRRSFPPSTSGWEEGAAEPASRGGDVWTAGAEWSEWGGEQLGSADGAFPPSPAAHRRQSHSFDPFPDDARLGETPNPASFPHLDKFSPLPPDHLGPRGRSPFPLKRSDSRGSSRTVLHEARAAAPSTALPPPPPTAATPAQHPPSPEGSVPGSSRSSSERDLWAIREERERKEREKKLEWERARRGAEDPLAGLGRSASKSAYSQERSSRLSGPSRRQEKILAEGHLLVPPSEPIFPHAFHHPALWPFNYAILTSRGLQLLRADEAPHRLFSVKDVMRVGRLDEHDQEAFEPFFVELRSGERVVLAGQKKLDAAYWVLALDNARASSHGHASSPSSSGRTSSSRSSPSSRSVLSPFCHSQTTATTPASPVPSPATYNAHLSRLEKLIADMDRRRSSLPQPKDDWTSNFNKNVQAYATIVELPSGAGEDNWGEPELHDERGAFPPPAKPDFSHGWPARPPPEMPRPSSPPSIPHPPPLHPHAPDLLSDPSYLRPEDAVHLQAILDSLLDSRAALRAGEHDAHVEIEAVRDELRWMKEEVEARCEAEGKVGEAERALLDKLDWLLHLNDVRARKHRRAASLDGSVSGGFGLARPSSVQEDNLVGAIQQHIAAMLHAAREAEGRAQGGAREVRREELVVEEGLRDAPRHPSPTLPTQTPQTYHQHASDAVFSPVSFNQPGQDGWGTSFAAAGEDFAFDATARAATPGLASKFSPNTSEHITPPRAAPSPTQDYGEPGHPLPPFPPAEEEPSYEQQLRDLPSSLRHHPDYHYHRSPAAPFPPGEMNWEEQERRPSKHERELYLQELYLAVEDGFRRQQDYIAASSAQDARMSQRLKGLLESLRAASLDRQAQDASFIHRLQQIALLLKDLEHPSTFSALDHHHSHSHSSRSPPPYPHSLHRHHSTHRVDQRAPGGGGGQGGAKSGMRTIPQSKLALLPGNGRLGPRVVAAERAPRGSAVLTKQKGVQILGGPDPIPTSHHGPRWADGASGAKAAKELDALIAHQQRHERSPSVPPQSRSAGKATAKAKGKGKEHPIVREMEANEAVRAALDRWKGEELAREEDEKRKGEGVVDPAAKAFAIFEILHATRKISKKQKEEADRLKKAAKQGGRVKAAAVPSAPKYPQDDFAALVSRLLSSSEPPDQILTGLASLLDSHKVPAKEAPKGWKNEKETKRALRELLRDRAAQKKFEQLKSKEQRELDALRKKQAQLHKELGDQMRTEAAIGR